ncbi:MAG: putative DNA binding domain-containing protein [Spirochaetaceae bacterium]|nr:putative DNA binding domain-containing protein [Spirochaetaceae bacterium]
MAETPEQLAQRIRLGEDSALEIKEVTIAHGRVTGPRRDQLADELAAFANANGGTLVLGVEDRARCVTGIPPAHLDAAERLVADTVQDSITPPLDADIRKLELPGPQDAPVAVLRVDVRRGLSVHKSPGGYLRRIGSSKRQMEPEYLARLFELRGRSRLRDFGTQAIAGASVDDLDPRLVDRFRGEISDDDRATALLKLDMVAEEESGARRPTVAGVLLGSRLPQRWLPQAFIQAVAYRGTSIAEALDEPRYQLDAKDLDGPLDDQIAYACRFVSRNQRVEASKAVGRCDWPQYDPAAIFEAVVNAVAHRDYSIRGAKIRLRMFSDRIELSSPGMLMNGMTVADLPYRQQARNPAITNLLDRCPIPEGLDTPRLTLMDRRGEGVPAILARSTKLSGKRPVYDLFGDELRLTIFAASPEASP